MAFPGRHATNATARKGRPTSNVLKARALWNIERETLPVSRSSQVLAGIGLHTGRKLPKYQAGSLSPIRHNEAGYHSLARWRGCLLTAIYRPFRRQKHHEMWDFSSIRAVCRSVMARRLRLYCLGTMETCQIDRLPNSEIDMQNTTSLEGHLLIAAPRMNDDRFQRTVILVLHHDDDGAFGVILNKPLPQTIGGLSRNLGRDIGVESNAERSINMGGPVSGPIIAIHGLESAAELEVPPGVFIAEQKEHLLKLIQEAGAPLRIFVGHAGWSAGQLEDEITDGAWFTLPATIDHVFSDSEKHVDQRDAGNRPVLLPRRVGNHRVSSPPDGQLS